MIAWRTVLFAPKVEGQVRIPCAKRLPFIISGLAFLEPALTRIQFYNITLVATALVLGSRFHLSQISMMWLKSKSVSTLSYLFSHAKFSTKEMQALYLLQMLKRYTIRDGYFLIDDTMSHHTKFCQWIHGVFILFDHTLGTNLKAICVVFLYYSDGCNVKFPITFRIYYKGTGKLMPWQLGKQRVCKTKYDLAIEMLEWALDHGFPKCIVLADSWYGIAPFVKELKRLHLSYVLEIKSDRNVKVPCQEVKLTAKGRVAKRQFDTMSLSQYFQTLSSSTRCGFPADLDKNRPEKVLYVLKVATAALTAIPGRHRIVESIDPAAHTAKYLVTDQLTWEAIKIFSVYSQRWTIEEFFRNAKQLTDMEGAMIRSEQGVTLALCLVSWLDSLLHLENYEQCTAEKLPKESVTIPSIVRKAQDENLQAFIERVRHDDEFAQRWVDTHRESIDRKRRPRKPLAPLQEITEASQEEAA